MFSWLILKLVATTKGLSILQFVVFPWLSFVVSSLLFYFLSRFIYRQVDPNQLVGYYGDPTLLFLEVSEYEKMATSTQNFHSELQKAKGESKYLLEFTKEEFNKELRSLREDMEAVLKQKQSTIDSLKLALDVAQKESQKEHQRTVKVILVLFCLFCLFVCLFVCFCFLWANIFLSNMSLKSERN